MIRLLLLLLLAVPAAPVAAETVVLGLSQDEVSITTTFDGSDVLIFGAVKRDAPAPEGPPLEIAITVAGPEEPVIVRRKERVAGIWVNTEAMRMDSAPSYYAVATTSALSDTLSFTEDLRHHISIPLAIRSVGEREGVTDPEAYRAALIRIRAEAGQYQIGEGEVQLEEETLFRARIELPANLREGPYEIRIFLARDGRVIDTYMGTIQVRKVGFERMLYTLAHERPLVYGLMSVAIAIAAGWGASAAFRLIRG